MADTTTTPAPTTLFKKRAPKSTVRKRPATPPPDSSSSGSETDDSHGAPIKRRKITGVRSSAPSNTTKPTDLDQYKASSYAADTSTTISKSEDATKTSHWSTLDATAKAPNPLRTSTSTREKNNKTIGPQKSTGNVRTITVTDFAPDVCKDYKKTGFCGFGDSCKFLHAREDYKQGWELDKDWEKAGNKSASNTDKGGGQVTSSLAAKKAANVEGADLEGMGEKKLDELLEGIPFACVICEESYKAPVVTPCGHYFCEKCALQRYRKDPSCAVCGQGTGGMFSGARTLKRLLEKKKERARQRRETARERGEQVSGDEDEVGKGN